MQQYSTRNFSKGLTSILLSIATSTSAMAFTQIGAGGAIPMGHEWLTRRSALELLNADNVVGNDAADPRLGWNDGLAHNLDLSNAQHEVQRIKSISKRHALYEPRYDDVFAAIVGERWVDTAGFNVAKATVGKIDCFSAVAQEPADVQQDHFMRRYDDVGGQGGVNAARRAQQRFINHFINAAMAEEKSIKAWDGGGYSSLEKVSHNYFLFGRAVHLFQDSFSPEHAVRLAEDNFVKVRQVKAYLCSEGAEQHTHNTQDAMNFSSGDVIWKKNTRLDAGWGTYKASNMKPVALVALEASKDLWAGFIRTMATPRDERRAVAEQEAQGLVNHWLSFDEQEMLNWYEEDEHRDHTYVKEPGQSGSGSSLFDCMVGLGVTSGSQAQRVAELDQQRRQCLFNVRAATGYADLNDPLMDIPYHWQWVSSTQWKTPVATWKIPQLPADAGKSVVVRNSVNGDPLVAPAGLAHNSDVYGAPGEAIEFIFVGDFNNEAYFRTKDNADLFLSYSAVSGKGLLYNTPNKAGYRVQPYGVLWTIENTYWNDFLWHNSANNRVYVSGNGTANASNSQWIIDGLQ